MTDGDGEIAFAREHIQLILEGRKWVTMRLPGEYDEVGVRNAVESESPIALVDANGECFALVYPTACWRIPLRYIPRSVYRGHRQYATIMSAADELESYYPDCAPIDMHEPIDVIEWPPETVTPVGGELADV